MPRRRSVDRDDLAAPMRIPGPVTVNALRPEDRAAWEVLARGYKEFYATPTADAEYSSAWQRLLSRDGVHGLGGFIDGELVGIAHYLFHTSVWARSNCYLQDLFTSPAARGRGVARALIEAVAAQARLDGASRFYWLTQEHNAVARALYDKVASHRGFIRYDFPLPEPVA
jgi:GNAT superfamily N-acetyltransferase